MSVFGDHANPRPSVTAAATSFGGEQTRRRRQDATNANKANRAAQLQQKRLAESEQTAYIEKARFLALSRCNFML